MSIGEKRKGFHKDHNGGRACEDVGSVKVLAEAIRRHAAPNVVNALAGRNSENQPLAPKATDDAISTRREFAYYPLRSASPISDRPQKAATQNAAIFVVQTFIPSDNGRYICVEKTGTNIIGSNYPKDSSVPRRPDGPTRSYSQTIVIA
jgi:hypothetical protein